MGENFDANFIRAGSKFAHLLAKNCESRPTLSKSLAAKSKEANEATSILIDASAYVALTKRFTAHRNWESFAAAFRAQSV